MFYLRGLFFLLSYFSYPYICVYVIYSLYIGKVYPPAPLRGGNSHVQLMAKVVMEEECEAEEDKTNGPTFQLLNPAL